MTTFVVLALLAAGALVLHQVHQGKQSHLAWGQTAEQLKLDYQPGRLFSGAKMDGVHRGYGVRASCYVRKRGNSSKRYTRLTVQYPALGMDLDLQRSYPLSSLRRLVGREDIEVGDAEFDDAILVEGSRPADVAEFLTRERRHELLRMFAKYGTLRVADNHVRFSRRGYVTDAAVLMQGFDDLCDLADLITDGKATPGPGETRPVATVPAAVAPEPAPEATPAPDLEPTPAASPEPVAALPAETVCASLFAGSTLSSETQSRFAADFQGKAVRWSGKLSRIERLGSSAKAHVDLLAVDDGYGGSRAIRALVPMDAETAKTLQSARGSDITLEGQLQACDPYQRTLTVSGRVLT